jgi:branched-chain amino acid transport system substrate-binding protein
MDRLRVRKKLLAEIVQRSSPVKRADRHSPWSRRIAVLGALAMAVGPIAVCAQTALPFSFTAILPLTGNNAFIAAQEQRSLQGVAKYINAHGGIHGRPLQFDYLDDTNSPAVAVQLASKLIDEKVPAIIGGGTGATCRALAALAKDGPVIYCLTPAVQPVHGGYMFSTPVGYDDQIFATIRYFAARGIKRFSFISTTDASGQQADLDIDEALRKPENRSVQIVDREKLGIGDISATAQVTRMMSAKPEAILALVTTIGNLSYAQMDAYKAFLPTEYLLPGPPWAGSADAVPPGPLRSAIQKYFDIMKAVDVKPADVGAASAYDPAMLLLTALNALPLDTTAARVRDYVNNLRDFPLADGIYNFRLYPNRGLSIADCIIVRWDAAGYRYHAVSGPGGNALKKPAK